MTRILPRGVSPPTAAGVGFWSFCLGLIMKIEVPAEFDMVLHLVNDETGQNAKVTIGIGALSFPTQQKVEDRIKEFQEKEMGSVAPGFRVCTDREAWDAICMEKTGQTFAFPHEGD